MRTSKICPICKQAIVAPQLVAVDPLDSTPYHLKCTLESDAPEQYARVDDYWDEA